MRSGAGHPRVWASQSIVSSVGPSMRSSTENNARSGGRFRRCPRVFFYGCRELVWGLAAVQHRAEVGGMRERRQTLHTLGLVKNVKLVNRRGNKPTKRCIYCTATSIGTPRISVVPASHSGSGPSLYVFRQSRIFCRSTQNGEG